VLDITSSQYKLSKLQKQIHYTYKEYSKLSINKSTKFINIRI